ncbi:MAG: HAD-IIB family hydrolase [Betaproteobacteria bacterium]
MKPLSAFPADALRRIRGVLFDIDDTLTTEGRLTADAYAALNALKTAGFICIPITGRPAGWCDHIARMWPVDGVVGENGAFYFYFDPAEKKLRQRFIKDERTRAQDREKIAAVAAKILAAVPGTALASDQNYREADIAIDFCEDVPALTRTEIERIKTLMESEGLTAKISSIHVNGWLGDYDKLSTSKLFMRERFGIDLDSTKEQFVFVGDSPNDAPMFGYFPYSFGVANVKEFEDVLTSKPAYVTPSRCGAGFGELAVLLVSAAEANKRGK